MVPMAGGGGAGREWISGSGKRSKKLMPGRSGALKEKCDSIKEEAGLLVLGRDHSLRSLSRSLEAEDCIRPDTGGTAQ